MTSRVGAPGAGWRPAGQFKKAGLNSDVVENLNAMADAAGRANAVDFGKEGIHTSQGFYQTSQSQSVTVSFKWALAKTPLSPGTWDFPTIAMGTVLNPGGSQPNSLVRSTDEIEMVNYSPNIFAPQDGLVLVAEINQIWVAIHAAC